MHAATGRVCMNGLLYDRLADSRVRGTRIDIAAVLRARLIGVGARQE